MTKTIKHNRNTTPLISTMTARTTMVTTRRDTRTATQPTFIERRIIVLVQLRREP